MAELGFILALPRIVDLLVGYGEWIADTIHRFQNARGVWAELGRFGWNLSQGQLRGIVLAAKSFYLEEGWDLGLRNALELQIRQLASDIDVARSFLAAQNPTHLFGRAIFTLSGEMRARQLNRSLALDKQSLVQTLAICDIRARRVPGQLVLDRLRFVHHDGAGYQPVPSAQGLFVAHGDYREDPHEGRYQRTAVIIEQVADGEHMAEAILKEIAGFLHYRFSEKAPMQPADVLLKGILPCLGYRMEPVPELIFAMPEDCNNPQTLQALIAADGGVPRHPLDFRFRLARKLCEAVLRVHVARLVHKNIRPNTILIMQPAVLADTVGFGDVYLTNWRLLRDAMGPTRGTGQDDWMGNVYRHPKRHGVHVEERYNMGHDIYSLGACLIEIGMWDLLVLPGEAGGAHRPSASQLSTIGHPDLRADLRNNRPTDVKNLLLELARETLPSRMGLGYTRLVIGCLTGLDTPSGFGPGVDFTDMNKVEQCVAFKEVVLSFFTEMSI